MVIESESFHQEKDIEILKSMQYPLVWGGGYIFKSLMTCSIAQSQQKVNSQPMLLATDSELGWHVNVVGASFMTGRGQRQKWNQFFFIWKQTSWGLWSESSECISANITTYSVLLYFIFSWTWNWFPHGEDSQSLCSAVTESPRLLVQGMANIFCEGPKNKYFQLCGPFSLSQPLALLLYIKAAIHM